jgi:hypothetical protein
MQNLFVALLVFGLLGCSSAEKNAQEKLENGEFQSAMEIYDRILKHDPSNLEAQEGQKRARGGVLGDKLIGVRKARASGNADAALDQLLEVRNLENAWNVFPPAAAKFTQDEETGFAWRPFSERIEVILRAKQPLRAELLWQRYSPVFAGAKPAAANAALGPEIARAGKSHCGDLVSKVSSREPNYAGFVGRYCRHWKATAAPRAGSDSGKARELISGIDWSGTLQGLSPDHLAIVRESLTDGLRSSAWYDPSGGRKLTVTLNGNYSFSHAKNLVTRVKDYAVNEDYSAMELVTKTREVPYVDHSTVVDPLTGARKSIDINRMRTESYSENTPVMHTRSVTRQFPYSALFHQQTIDFNGDLHTQLGGQDVAANESNKSAAEGDEQNLRNDAVGLAPMSPSLIDPTVWVKGESTKWRNTFGEKLRTEWISQICRTPGGSAKASDVAEAVLKCRREPSAGSLPFVADWYTQSFGLASADVERLLPEGK